MKKIIICLLGLFLSFSCSKEELNVSNPNDPTFDAIDTESGILQLAAGVYDNNISVGPFDYNYYWFVQAYHEAMGDAMYIPWGNWSFRWVNQPTSITLDNGSVITPPQEGSQGNALISRNIRTQGDGNAFAHEWMTMYKTNNVCNLILDKVDGIDFTVNGKDALPALKAWAYFWKGYVYSRIGSMYQAGLIIDEPNVTNSNYVDRKVIIEEAKKNFDEAISYLNKIEGTGDILNKLYPDHLIASSFRGSTPSTSLTKDMFIRNINSLKARNILINIKADKLSTTELQEIKSLVNKGLQAEDFLFVMKQDGNNFNTSSSVPYRLLIGWHFISERLVQDFKSGDKRYEDNIVKLDAPEVNRSGRGIQYGTRWGLKQGDYASTLDDAVNIYYGVSYSENELMKAEVLIRENDIEGGLTIIDRVRDYQNSNLASVAGTNLSKDQALEELRKERRIGLLFRGVSFYDARRWGVTDPVSEGGGRKGAVVLDGVGNINTNATFNYNYLDYWEVPAQELEFNAPSDGSSPVTKQ